MAICSTGLDYAATTCQGSLTLNSVSMHTPAWAVTNIVDLYLPAQVRGDDRLLPGVPGVRAYRRRRTVTQRDLTLVIIGNVDHLGVDHPDVWQGFEENLAYLRTNVFDPTNVGDGTIAASLAMPSGATRTGNVHVLGLERNSEVVDGSAIFTLTISIPAGVLA